MIPILECRCLQMYDIFYISKNNGNFLDWEKIKSRYPYAQKIDNVVSYDQIQSKAFTKMFWIIWDDLDLLDSFNITDYKATKWDDMYIHVFKNGDFYDGVGLFPKNVKISTKEFYHRFFTNKKEIDIEVSKPKKYNVYSPKSYEEYEKITDEMFWLVWPELTIIDSTLFDMYFSHHNSYDRRENHVFKNLCNNTESYLSGVILCSKYKPLSSIEFYNQYAVDKKEYDRIVSKYQYPIYKINTYEDYLEIVNTEKQKMFWCQWPNIEVIDDSIFDFYFDPNDGSLDYDRAENHIFKNACNDSSSYINGMILCSKFKPISKKEFNARYVVEKKEYDIVATRYRYPRYVLNSYEDYLNIFEKETQKMFWGIWPEIEITDNTIFDFYFDPKDWKTKHNIEEHNTFKHKFNNKIITHNSPVLFSSVDAISKREFNFRAIANKKENDRLISCHKSYDVFFISYEEKNADENFQKLLSKCPRAKRVHGITGIHQAHIKAASMSNTDMIWVVDGDAIIDDDFNFDLVYFSYGYEIDCVHVWKSLNPINNLEYGYGGVKLLPRKLTLEMNINSPDMTTSISKKFKTMEKISNINAFNVDEFTTWRSAFRECCKLASRVIDRQYEEETKHRLDIWCTIGSDKPYGNYAIQGALAGRKYGEENKDNLDALSKINDFNWLKQIFNSND
jgi:hypothetical protein